MGRQWKIKVNILYTIISITLKFRGGHCIPLNEAWCQKQLYTTRRQFASINLTPLCRYVMGMRQPATHRSSVLHIHLMYVQLTREIKMTIAMANEAFNRKVSPIKSKLNIEPRNKLVRCHAWSIALYRSETWTLRKLERKYLENLKWGAGGEKRR